MKDLLDRGKLDYGEQPPLFDLASLFLHEDWQPISECRLWIANADHEATPDDVFVVLFRAIEYEEVVTLRAVCQRFRQIIDNPFYALRKWAHDEPLVCGDEVDLNISLFRINPVDNSKCASYELQEGEDEYTVTFPHLDDCLVIDLVRSDSPVGFALFKLIAQRPRWFLEANVCYTDDRFFPQLSYVINLSQVEMDYRTDPNCGLVETSVLFQSKYDPLSYSKPFKSHFEYVLTRGLPLVSRENASASHREELTTAQQQLVEWLQHAEHCILRGEPLAVMRPRLRTTAMTGTAFSFQPSLEPNQLLLDVEQNPEEVKIALDSRGVLVADEPGLGKTRSITQFLLGSVPVLSHLPSLVAAGDPVTVADTGASLHRLLWTRAIDFGSELPGVVDELLPHGMLHTSASLVIASTTTYSTWKREVALLFPHKRVFFIGTKAEHEKLLYGNVATADLVVVTAQFLMNRAYYEPLRWPGFRAKVHKIRSKIAFLAEAKNSLKLLTAKHLKIDFKTARPLFEWFAWPRIVVDEIHTYIPSTFAPTGRLSDFNKLGLEFFSARFVVAVSATPQMSVQKRVSNRCQESSQFVDLILNKWMRTGYRFTNLRAQQDWVRSFVPPHYLRDAPGKQCDWSDPFPIMLFESNMKIVARTGTIFRSHLLGLPQQAMPALIHRNTIRNVKRELDIPPVKTISVNMRLNPAIQILHLLVRQSNESMCFGGRGDVVPLSMCFGGRGDVFPLPLDRLRLGYIERESYELLADYDTLWPEFIVDIGKRVDKLNRIAALVASVDLARVPVNRRPFVMERMETVDKATSILRDLPQRLEDLARGLQERISFRGAEERRHGSRAYFIVHTVRAVLAHSPSVRVIVAAEHKSAVEFLLKTYVNEPFVTLGGLNLHSTLAREKEFTSGKVRLLLLDATKAAEGLNLQRAHVLILDKNMNTEDHMQLVGRVRRPGAEQPPLVIERGLSENVLKDLLSS